ncbi:methyltransferase regulatory domain-containing protein [Suttonella sp. R2A3]|uniref:methyltransferase regulatory domain-containing protein n=1 Tax=Suttonella sp. R2A3 TaxID=2908648 RepID=UPI001F3C3966|nr:methyltransferase regulatory domain-containing protein [Suttonella sp. R2A3]UJF23656.1 methyltransferase regulatory domain-containing protein [Suttonella sp. R2A3]
MAQAQEADLAFIGEAQYESILAPATDDDLAAMLEQECAGDVLAKQQYQDFLNYQNTRQTLLTHQSNTPFHDVNSGLKNDALLSMYLQGGFRPPTEEAPVWQSLQNPAVQVKDNAISRLVCGQLNQAGLSNVLAGDIVESAPSEQRQDTMRMILLLVANQTVMVRASALHIENIRLTDKPKLHPILAEMVAARAAHPGCFGLSNRWHQELVVSPSHEAVMQLLDGTHDRNALIEALSNAWQNGHVTPPQEVDPQNTTTIGEHAELVVKQTLSLLSAQGLLEEEAA